MISISSATVIQYKSGHNYVVEAVGGSVTVERQLADGSWAEVPGSPVADGESKFLNTTTHGRNLRFTPSDTISLGFAPAVSSPV